MALELVGLIVFIIIAALAVFLALLGLPGAFVIVLGALLYDLITWSLAVSWKMLAILAALAVLAEVLEAFVMVFGAKLGGVSKHGTFGTVAGAIIGGLLLSALLPLIGTIIGVFVGAVLGAFFAEFAHTHHPGKAWKAALTALIGRGLVSVVKLVIVVGQIALVLTAI
ncbi:hypothetical protein CMO91_05245 [Candidatus Woesearchaeota archaeon]|jgi:uncharacterized protein YqgC (DUF456 family)|nr:hypothetical protein [Candidatus Woesearchaeota archaeon]